MVSRIKQRVSVSRGEPGIRREERYRGEVVRGRDKAAELSSRKGKERNAREDRGGEGGDSN